MRKIFIKFAVVFLAFSLGIASTFVWINYRQNKKSQESETDNLPILALCELVGNPEKYDGKKVRISAHLHWYQHGYYLNDNNCPSVGEAGRVAITFDEQNGESSTQRIREIQGKQFLGMGEKINIIAIGRFKVVDFQGSVFGGNIDERTPLHFEIIVIEKGNLEKLINQ